MKEHNDPIIERQLHMFMQESKETAPAGFSDRLMQAVTQKQLQPLPAHIFRPLFSAKAITLAAAVFITLGLLAFYFIPAVQEEAASWLRYSLPESSLPFVIDGSLLMILMMTVFLLVALDAFLKRRLGAR